MRILVGLGNPGPEYRSTRHNVGFLVVGEIRRRHGEPAERRVARSLVSRVPVGVEGLLLARPQSYMNRSGPTVADLLERERADPGEMLVVCDDLNLELGINHGLSAYGPSSITAATAGYTPTALDPLTPGGPRRVFTNSLANPSFKSLLVQWTIYL